MIKTIIIYFIFISNLLGNNKYNFSTEEKLFIKSNPVIKFSDANWKPLIIIEDNKISGLLKDYIDLISKESNIKFQFTPSRNWSHAIEMFNSNEINFITSDETKLGQKKGLLSNQLTKFPLAYVTNNKILYISSLKDVKDKTFALPKYFSGYLYVKENYPNAKIIETDTIAESLVLLAKNEADVYLGHMIPTIYNLEKLRLSNLKISGKTNYEMQHHLLVNEKDHLLLSIINKVISKITVKEKEKIYSDWVYIELKESFDYSLLWKIALLISVIFISILYYNKKLKKLVSEKTLELSELNENLEVKVKNRTEELSEYKKHTSESIAYASMIQESLLPSAFDQDDYFKESFAIWEPKDVVGGDIYIFEKIRDEDEAIVMVIDCTGHGIPGAFMTMLFKAFEKNILTSLVHDNKDISPAEILQVLNREIKTILKQENKESNSNAGLDAGIMYFDKKRKLLKYAGAVIPLFYIKDSQIHTIKGDKQSVGYKTSEINYVFTDHEIQLEKDTSFYLSTDGYYDQNGGEKSFCFGKRRFQQILLDINQLPMYKQKEILMEKLNAYQNNEERNDDITVIGLKV